MRILASTEKRGQMQPRWHLFGQKQVAAVAASETAITHSGPLGKSVCMSFFSTGNFKIV